MSAVAPGTEIWGWDVTPKVGRYILPDGWSHGECLTEGDHFSTFRLPTGYSFGVTSVACEIEVTGRTLREVKGFRAVRVKITFPGDCEPDTVMGGYMSVPWN